jgi:hypothetical protein
VPVDDPEDLQHIFAERVNAGDPSTFEQLLYKQDGPIVAR